MSVGSLDLTTLGGAYESGAFRPHDVVHAVHERIAARDGEHVWISRVPLDALLARAAAVEAQRAAGSDLPLYGIPFAVKDNIDVANAPTTAACPDYAYTPKTSATVVERLLHAGAIYVGKTNLDQFATGLVGTRSPYGPCANPFDPTYISGGSSAGSAVAVAAGLASFALGTDTAGSGRVPAAFNNIVGLKPTRGLLSMNGVVPACRSLDCVSIFALTSADACKVLNVAAAFDPDDPYSRRADASAAWSGAAPFRFGAPMPAQREFFGDGAAGSLYEQALARLEALGGCAVEVDYEPFREVAILLYEGPWVAERLASVRDFVRAKPEAIHPVVCEILLAGERYDAVDVFLAQDRLQQLKRGTESAWNEIDVLALPTAPTIYTIADVMAEPIKRNTDLGYYTNFVNLLDLCALAVPAGARPDRLPFGITLIAPAFREHALCTLGARYEEKLARLGATPYSLPKTAKVSVPAGTHSVRIAVVGAHLSGQPLNHQLTDRG
ncbi:MAG TPA: allophanate hydrolase, partial [Burkholderiales bacterium]